MELKQIVQNIFSVRNIDNHKQISVLGLKIKLKSRKLTERAKLLTLENKIIDLSNHIKLNLSNDAFAAIFIKDLHHKTFLKYKNINTNRNVVLVSAGPSMKYYQPLPNAIHIGVNRCYQNSNIKLDYIFTHDYHANHSYIDEILNYPAKIFFGVFLTKAYPWMDIYQLPVKYRNLENVNYYVSDYERNLCYPELEYFPLMDFGSIAFSAMHFALYTNPKKIYIVGADCSSGYFDGKNSGQDMSYLVEGWKKIKQFAKTYYPDTELISINPVGLKGVFKDVYTQGYIKGNN